MLQWSCWRDSSFQHHRSRKELWEELPNSTYLVLHEGQINLAVHQMLGENKIALHGKRGKIPDDESNVLSLCTNRFQQERAAPFTTIMQCLAQHTLGTWHLHPTADFTSCRTCWPTSLWNCTCTHQQLPCTSWIKTLFPFHNLCPSVCVQTCQ